MGHMVGNFLTPPEPQPPALLLKTDVCLALCGAKSASLRRLYQASEAGDFLFLVLKKLLDFCPHLHENNFHKMVEDSGCMLLEERRIFCPKLAIIVQYLKIKID